NQYQLVAAIAKTPATKLLGTSPKGFNATGEHETISYHEELESIQEHIFDPLLERHYLLLAKSEEIDVQLEIVWNPVDSTSSQQQAE
ncbi:anti-CBASS protein Acb1 family protein, partial [Staphylococcus aureus]